MIDNNAYSIFIEKSNKGSTGENRVWNEAIKPETLNCWMDHLYGCLSIKSDNGQLLKRSSG